MGPSTDVGRCVAHRNVSGIFLVVLLDTKHRGGHVREKVATGRNPIRTGASGGIGGIARTTVGSRICRRIDREEDRDEMKGARIGCREDVTDPQTTRYRWDPNRR